jgi:hypothetical protein
MPSLTQEYIEQNSGLHRSPTNFSIGLGGGQVAMGSYGGGVNLAQTSTNDDITKTATFKPQLYYDELRNYSYLKTLVNLLKAPIAEGIDQINGQITVMPSDPNNPLQKDAAIIVNNFFEKCDFKKFITDHLDEFILRGSYMAYIDYKNGNLRDVMNPYDFFMIYTATKGCTWIIPNEINKSNNAVTGASTMISSLADFTQNSNSIHGMFANMFVRYYHGQEVTNKQSREVLERAKENPELLATIKAILGGSLDMISNLKLTEDTQKRLDKMTVLYSVTRPVSLFEPYLKKLFTLSIKEMVFDMLSLLQYLKADYFTVSMRVNTPNDTAASQIVNNVKNALNRYNAEFINSFEDPSGIIRRVYDKLMNRAVVLPMVDEFSDIQSFNIPDIEQRINTLYQDIVENKRTIADEVGIAQESISGGSNRWESISRNEKMTLNILYIKSTIENFVKDAACAIFFNHSNESFWDYRYNNKELPTTFHFNNQTHKLTGPDATNFAESLNGMLYNIVDDQTIKDGNRVGITTMPSDFDFTLNLSTVLDSYASKTKEGVINDTMQSITGVMDSIRTFANYQDIVDPGKAANLIQSLINIGDYTSKILDMEKVRQMFEQPPQQEPQGEEGMEGMEGGEIPAYFNRRG